jgi:hypothetical protein
MCTIWVLAADSRRPQGGEHGGDVFAQGLDVVAGAVYRDDEVVGVVDDPPVRQAIRARGGVRCCPNDYWAACAWIDSGPRKAISDLGHPRTYGNRGMLRSDALLNVVVVSGVSGANPGDDLPRLPPYFTQQIGPLTRRIRQAH